MASGLDFLQSVRLAASRHNSDELEASPAGTGTVKASLLDEEEVRRAFVLRPYGRFNVALEVRPPSFSLATLQTSCSHGHTVSVAASERPPARAARNGLRPLVWRGQRPEDQLSLVCRRLTVRRLRRGSGERGATGAVGGACGRCDRARSLRVQGRVSRRTPLHLRRRHRV
eukprot:7145195-Prymnesium_polylepis.1